MKKESLHKSQENLVKADTRYYHTALCQVEILAKDKGMRLSVRGSFSLEDVLRYFYAMTDGNDRDKERDIAQLGALYERLSFYQGTEALDLLLYLIDVSALTMPVAEPFMMYKESLIQKALHRLTNAMHAHKERA